MGRDLCHLGKGAQWHSGHGRSHHSILTTMPKWWANSRLQCAVPWIPLSYQIGHRHRWHWPPSTVLWQSCWEYETFWTKQAAKIRDHTVHLSELMDRTHKFTLNSKIAAPSTVSESQVTTARTTSPRKQPAPCAEDVQQCSRDPNLWCDFHQVIGHNDSMCCSNHQYCPRSGCGSPVKMETIVDHYRNSCKGKKCGLCSNNQHDTQ